jgi:hypothetical protein
MTEIKLVVIGTFSDRIEAELARSALEASGVESMVRADDSGGMRPQLAFSNGAEVLVREPDAVRAEEILRTPAKPE